VTLFNLGLAICTNNALLTNDFAIEKELADW